MGKELKVSGEGVEEWFKGGMMWGGGGEVGEKGYKGSGEGLGGRLWGGELELEGKGKGVRVGWKKGEMVGVVREGEVGSKGECG